MKYTVTLQQNHYEQLKEGLLCHSDGRETVGFILCGRSFIDTDPWTSTPEDRFLSRQVELITSEDVIESSSARVTWQTRAFIRVLKQAEEKNFGIIVVHNHPSGDPTPSPDDVALTRAVVEAGRLLDVEVLDHLVVGQRGWVSLKERKLGFG